MFLAEKTVKNYVSSLLAKQVHPNHKDAADVRIARAQRRQWRLPIPRGGAN
jgi:DNA-binding NarL/FixJ family response regulator